MIFFEPAPTVCASPIVFVPKKNGILRCFVDYRKLHAANTRDSYFLQRMDEYIDSVGDDKIFITLDIKTAFGRSKCIYTIVRRQNFPRNMVCTNLQERPSKYLARLLHFNPFWTSYSRQSSGNMPFISRRHCHVSRIPNEHSKQTEMVLLLLRYACIAPRPQKCAFSQIYLII